MAEFIDIIAQLKFDVQGDGTLKNVGVSLDKATTEAQQLEAQINGLKGAIKETDNAAKKGILQKELHKANIEAKQLKTNTANVQKEVAKTGGTFQKFGQLAAGAFAGFSILQIGQQIIDATSQFQKFEAVLTNLTGDNGEAKRLIATFSQFAAETPFQVEEVVGAYVKLRNTGITPNIEAMRKLGDVASASGKDLNQLVEALIDAQVGENERLKEFGIRAQKAGEITKFTFRGITTEVKNTSEAINAYITGLGDVEGVKGANEAIAKTLGGQLSNLKDAFTGLFVEIGKSGEGVVSGFIQRLSTVIGGFSLAFKLINQNKESIDETNKLLAASGTIRRTPEQFNFVQSFLDDVNKAVEYGGKGTLARVRGLQDGINKAFEEGVITQGILLSLSNKLRETELAAQKEIDGKKKVANDEQTAAEKKAAEAAAKAAQQRKKAISDITQDLQDALLDQAAKLKETQLKNAEESLATITQISELEKAEALRAIDDRARAIFEKLGGKVPTDIKALLDQLRTGIQRQFELSLSQDIADFKAKQEKAIIEFETQRAADKAKARAKAAEELAEQRLAFLESLTEINDEQIAAVDIAENEALTAAQNIYNQGLISKERYEALKTDITKAQGEARIQLLINELEVERLALQNSEDKDGKLAKRITEINVAISALKLQQAQLGETTTDTDSKQKQLLSTIKTGYNEALSLVQQVNAAIVANETAKINALISLQQKRVDEANRIADEGNAEALEREQNRLETLLQQREEAAQRQERLSLILQASNFALAASEAVLAITKAGAFGGPAAPVTIGLVGAALAAGIGFILSLVNSSKGAIQAFNEGTPYVTGSDGIDRVPAMLTKGERVVTVDDNQRYSPIYDYLSQHAPDPKTTLARLKGSAPNYAGLQTAYEANRRIEAERALSKALLEKLGFVNGNLEILVNETVKNRTTGKVKITNVNDIAKAVNSDNLRWKI